ncbi:FHA domain-containing protein [Streptomyces harbinensis]|uniref:FHA domain-containing protein n=2 Tax=Streptomyces TaxID=1883 RepID=UPI003699489F
MPTCPNGHQSAAEDWCEVCGYRMPAPAPAAAMPPPPGAFGQQPPGPPGPPAPPPGPPGYPAAPPMQPAPAGEHCPQCRTPREAQAPFCEGCRYNFLTNSPTTYIPPLRADGPPIPGAPPQHQQPPHQPPHQPPAPPHPYGHGHGHQPPPAPPAPGGAPGQTGDWVLPPPAQQPPQQAPGGYGYPPRGGAWMVTVGPDPDYFQAMMRRSGPEAAQLSLPPYAPPRQLPLSGPQVTVGRRRQSTGESPDIDLSQPSEDPGVSHQHAVLVQQPDGSWAVVDQDSTNGTTVNGSEDPIQPFVPVPLREGDRVHVGAWTTITLYRG